MATETHLFRCSCENATDVTFEDLKKHLSEVHGLTTKEDLTASREMTMHLDGSKFFSSTYKWTLKGGLTFTEFYQGRRSKKDLMWRK